VIAMIVLLVVTAVGRLGASKREWAALLAGLGIAQMIFAWIGGSVPALGFLHPVNALVIAAVAGRMASSAWREAKAVESAPVTAPTG
jgi:hypothetical protein